jgi:cytochrome c oxidase subunit IV
MKRGMMRLLLVWGLLILLGGTEFAASYLPLDRSWRPLVMIPGVLMVLVVAIGFMEVKKGPVLVRAFAVAGIFWLFVLLALGSADPLTRTNYYVPDAHVK